MFGRRSDGKKLKNIDPIIRLTSFIMPQRYDAMVNSRNRIDCTKIDEFIKRKAEEGIKISYMDIVIAGLVRMYALRPKLNRFIMNGNIYSRNKIQIAFTVKKRLLDTSDETTVKLDFDGTENLYQVKEKIDAEVAKNKGDDASNGTDKTAKILLKLPTWLLKFVMGIIKCLDRHGNLPKSLINVSPFHTSCFLTNMRSINASYVYHHIYDFGTTGLFISMGKDSLEPIVNPITEQIEIKKVMDMGLVIDERICDGLYNSYAIKIGSKYIENPELLEEGLKPGEVKKDPDL